MFIIASYPDAVPGYKANVHNWSVEISGTSGTIQLSKALTHYIITLLVMVMLQLHSLTQDATHSSYIHTLYIHKGKA